MVKRKGKKIIFHQERGRERRMQAERQMFTRVENRSSLDCRNARLQSPNSCHRNPLSSARLLSLLLLLISILTSIPFLIPMYESSVSCLQAEEKETQEKGEKSYFAAYVDPPVQLHISLFSLILFHRIISNDTSSQSRGNGGKRGCKEVIFSLSFLL